RNVALYLFDEGAGSAVHNQTKAGVDLYAPRRYMVLDQDLLEPFWQEFSMTRLYWSAVLKNIIGFVPFGFCIYPCLKARQVRRTMAVSVILGTVVSVTIEVLQVYLPTRDSGTTDLLTNTFGTYIGVLVFRVSRSVLVKTFRRASLVRLLP